MSPLYLLPSGVLGGAEHMIADRPAVHRLGLPQLTIHILAVLFRVGAPPFVDAASSPEQVPLLEPPVSCHAPPERLSLLPFGQEVENVLDLL